MEALRETMVCGYATNLVPSRTWDPGSDLSEDISGDCFMLLKDPLTEVLWISCDTNIILHSTTVAASNHIDIVAVKS